MTSESQQSLEFQVIDKIVAQGRKRLESMFRQTFDDLNKLQQDELDEQQLKEFDELMEAYQLVETLIIQMVDLKEDLRLRLMG
jgi:hypothetical protein